MWEFTSHTSLCMSRSRTMKSVISIHLGFTDEEGLYSAASCRRASMKTLEYREVLKMLLSATLETTAVTSFYVWQGQQSVAQQLLSQQPITSHSMSVQGGQPVISQPQFMAGAAQMASRPPSLLQGTAGNQQRPGSQASWTLSSLRFKPNATASAKAHQFCSGGAGT